MSTALAILILIACGVALGLKFAIRPMIERRSKAEQIRREYGDPSDGWQR